MSSTRVPETRETSASTLWGWLLMVLPFGWIVGLFAGDLEGYVIARDLDEYRGSSQFPIPGIWTTANHIEWTFVILLAALSIASLVLAFLDRRELRRRGLDALPHWAWAAVTPAYVVGRAIALRRADVVRDRGHLIPFAMTIVLAAVVFALCGLFIVTDAPNEETTYMNSFIP